MLTSKACIVFQIPCQQFVSCHQAWDAVAGMPVLGPHLGPVICAHPATLFVLSERSSRRLFVTSRHGSGNPTMSTCLLILPRLSPFNTWKSSRSSSSSPLGKPNRTTNRTTQYYWYWLRDQHFVANYYFRHPCLCSEHHIARLPCVEPDSTVLPYR
jgi:hypothetical protein